MFFLLISLTAAHMVLLVKNGLQRIVHDSHWGFGVTFKMCICRILTSVPATHNQSTIAFKEFCNTRKRLSMMHLDVIGRCITGIPIEKKKTFSHLKFSLNYVLSKWLTVMETDFSFAPSDTKCLTFWFQISSWN